MTTRSNVPTNMVLDSGINFEDFNNYDDWNNYNTKSTVELSELGAGIVKFTGTEVTSTFGMKRYRTNISASLDYVDNIGYIFYVPDITKVAKIVISWFNNTSSNRRELVLYSPYDGTGTRREIEQGWNFIKVPVRNWSKKSSDMDWTRKDVVQHEILCYPTSGNTATIHFKTCIFNQRVKNYACLAADDGIKSVYTGIHDWLLANNIPLNMFISYSFAQQGNPTYLSETELQTMYDTGIYEFCNHSYANPADLYTLTDAQISADYTNNKDWMISKGWNRKYSAYTYATPGAGYIWRPATLDVLIGAGAKMIRTNRNYHANYLPFQGYGVHDLFSSSIGYNTNIDSYLSDAYNYYRNGCLFIPYFHGVGDGGGLETPLSTLKQIITGLKSIGYQFIKLMDWYEMYNNSKRKNV